MHSSTWHLQTFLLSIFAITFLYLVASQVVSQDVPKPWYENLPAVAMDYKVHIDAGKEDCYHQYVQAGATFYVSFSVVRGGDGMAGFAVRNPSGAIVKPYQWQATADYTDQVSPGGYYSVCIDNQFSRFAGKLVNIYITVVKYDAWDKYAKEIEALQLNMENFTSTIGTVERNINDMLAYQYHSRNREARDYALLEDNNAYIRNFSISQILVIVFTCSVQVGILSFVDIFSVFHYLHKLSQKRFFTRQLLCAKCFWVFFVRKLFTVKNSGSSRSRI